MKTMLTFAALLAASLSAPAFAEGTDTIRQSVRYADLDLSSENGVRALDRRIHNAASAACGTPSSADPNGKRAVKKCRAEARERAFSQRQTAIALARGDNATSLAAR